MYRACLDALKDWCLQCTEATMLRCWNDACHALPNCTSSMAKNGKDMLGSTWKCFLGQSTRKTFRLQKWQEKLGTRGQTEATLRLRLNKSYPLDVLYVLELEVTLHHPVLLSWESPKDIETARLVRSIHLRDVLKVFSFPSWESYLGKNTPWRNQAGNLKVPDSKHWSSQDEAGLVLVKSVGRTEKMTKTTSKEQELVTKQWIKRKPML